MRLFTLVMIVSLCVLGVCHVSGQSPLRERPKQQENPLLLQKATPPPEPMAAQRAEVTAVADELFTLSWKTPPPIAGVIAGSIVKYQVHWGIQSRVYPDKIMLGNVFTHTLTGLKTEQRYFLTVTAHQANGRQVYSYTETSVVFRGVPKSSVTLVPKDRVKAGETLTVNWHHTGSGTPRDWLGLAAVGAPAAEYVAWTFVNCSERETVADTKGKCPLTVPATLRRGDYEVRLYANDKYDILATSTAVHVE